MRIMILSMLAALAACDPAACEDCTPPDPCEWYAELVACAADVCPSGSPEPIVCVEACIADLPCGPASPLSRAYERRSALAEIEGDPDGWCEPEGGGT